MRELIAELPALTVAIPAISIALPIFSVLLLSAIFHWIFVPDKNSESKKDKNKADHSSSEAQNFTARNTASTDGRFIETSSATRSNQYPRTTDHSTTLDHSVPPKEPKTRGRSDSENPATDSSTSHTFAESGSDKHTFDATQTDAATTLQPGQTRDSSKPRKISTETTNNNHDDSTAIDALSKKAVDTPFHQKSPNANTAEWLAKRNDNNQPTDKPGELRVSLATAKGGSTEATKHSASTSEQGVDLKDPVTAAEIEKQADKESAPQGTNAQQGLAQQSRSAATKLHNQQTSASGKSDESSNGVKAGIITTGKANSDNTDTIRNSVSTPANTNDSSLSITQSRLKYTAVDHSQDRVLAKPNKAPKEALSTTTLSIDSAPTESAKTDVLAAKAVSATSAKSQRVGTSNNRTPIASHLTNSSATEQPSTDNANTVSLDGTSTKADKASQDTTTDNKSFVSNSTDALSRDTQTQSANNNTNTNTNTTVQAGNHQTDSSEQSPQDKLANLRNDARSSSVESTQNHNKLNSQGNPESNQVKLNPERTGLISGSNSDTASEISAAGTGSKNQPGHSNSNGKTKQATDNGDNKNAAIKTDSAANTISSPHQNQSKDNSQNASIKGSRSLERPRYQNAAKARYIPSSIEAQLQLKTPGASKTEDNGQDSAQSIASSNIANVKLLQEKDRLIKELEAKLSRLQQRTGDQSKYGQSNNHQKSTSDSINNTESRSNHQTTQHTDTALHTGQSANALSEDATDAPKGINSDTTVVEAASIDNIQNTAQSATTQSGHRDKEGIGTPAQLLAAVKPKDTSAQQLQLKRRYEQASEKLTLNEQKIRKLQSTVNRLQASGLVEQMNETPLPHGRKTLLSKVRVMSAVE